MHRLTQADLRDLGRYPVSLQQIIAALAGVEPSAGAGGLPDSDQVAPRSADNRPDQQQGSGIDQ
ncbi:hypothetical protein [Novosphingobium huizhouense]|uniref:hypothetical protein n=1 Tax=Novosphingobium huizhouense TaxID=2866625 RepID=UPI001CD88840|nr:hypothetical protein [Novosphingobium huizhouense]